MKNSLTFLFPRIETGKYDLLTSIIATCIILSGFFWCVGVPLYIAVAPSAALALLTRSNKKFGALLNSNYIAVAYCALYGSVNYLHQLRTYYLGMQGIDFAIFSQNIFRLIHNGVLETSLIGTRYFPFLEHHFSPIWYVPGIFARYLEFLFGSPPEILLLVHAATISVTLLLIKDFLREIGLPATLSCAFLILISLQSTLRTSLFWETREDVLFMPIVVLWLTSLQRKQFRTAALLTVPAIFFQEKLALVSGAIALATTVLYVKNSKMISAKAIWFLPFMAIGPVFFFLYDIVPGLLHIERSFRSEGRIISTEMFFHASHLQQIAIYIAHIAASPALFCFISGTSLVLSIPAFALLGINLVSNLPEMLAATEYYSLLIIIITSISGAYGLTKAPARMRLALLLLILIFTVAIKPNEYPKLFHWSQKYEIDSIVSQVPKDSIVVADDYSAALVYDTKQPMRLNQAIKNVLHYDYVLTKTPEASVIPNYILWSTSVCAVNELLTLRCKR